MVVASVGIQEAPVLGARDGVVALAVKQAAVWDGLESAHSVLATVLCAGV